MMRNRKILILDDDADYRKLLLTCLGGIFENTELVEYDPVSLGVPGKDYNWSDYDVLILDYDLRDDRATGLDILQANRGNPDFPLTIMLTGAGNEDVAVTALKAGVCDYFRKEKISKGQLQDSVRNAFNRQQLHKERTYTLEEARKVAKAEAMKLIAAYRAKYDSQHKTQMEKLLAEKERLEQEVMDSKKIFEHLEKLVHKGEREGQVPPVRPAGRKAEKVNIHIPGDTTLQMRKWELEPIERKAELAKQQQKNSEADLQKVKWKIKQEDHSKKIFTDDIERFRAESGKQQAESSGKYLEKGQRARAIAAETAREKQERKLKEQGMMDDISSQLGKDHK